MAFAEDQLGQLRPSDTNAVSLYSPADSTRWIAKKIVVCNTSTSSATFRIFHSKEGTTYDESTALFFDSPITAKQTITDTGFMAGSSSSGNVAVRSSAASALTFTLYGAEIT